MTTRKRWSKSIGERGRRVRLYEARPGGTIMRSTWVDGKEDRKSLGHRDKDMAVRQAYEMLASLHLLDNWLRRCFPLAGVELEKGGCGTRCAVSGRRSGRATR
jgi:hypothetical protein